MYTPPIPDLCINNYPDTQLHTALYSLSLWSRHVVDVWQCMYLLEAWAQNLFHQIVRSGKTTFLIPQIWKWLYIVFKELVRVLYSVFQTLSNIAYMSAVHCNVMSGEFTERSHWAPSVPGLPLLGLCLARYCSVQTPLIGSPRSGKLGIALKFSVCHSFPSC